MNGLHGLVLAAGASRRFGQPKQLLQIDNETLLHRACRQSLNVCDAVTVVLGAESARMIDAIDDLSLTRVDNPDWPTGVASSLRAGVAALPPHAAGVMIVLCDQVAVTATELRSLAGAWREQPGSIVAAAYAGVCGAPVIWPRDWFPALLALSGDQGGRDLLNASPVTRIEMPAAAMDIDTPADERRWRAG